jgi:hypothetical protein
MPDAMGHETIELQGMPPHRAIAARLVTGPAGHLVAGVADWAVLFFVWVRARARGRDPWA